MIVFEDAWLVVAHKPAGLPTQRTADGEDGLYEQLCRDRAYVGLHHRLDRNASGLVLFTVDRAVNSAIATGFREHSIQRTYRAWMEGSVDEGTWRWPVDKKSAVTRVKPLGSTGGLTDVVCQLETGRKHQIRVHAAMNGTPIAGDRRYGGDAARPMRRLALHAWQLALDHPATGEALQLECEPPDDLMKSVT